MKIQELRDYQLEFEKSIGDHQKGFKKINKKRKKFISDYSIEKLKALSKEEYVIGRQDHSTFCYRIENELNDWGNIHGSTAKKFGLYYGTLGDDQKNKYRIGKKSFGFETEEAFKNIINSIVNLIENRKNINALKKNLISPMFKGKILSVYFPGEFLNIFAATHLDYFINILGLSNFSGSELDKQNLLIHYKNNDPIMKNWTIYQYSKFLYTSFKSPNNEIDDKKIPKELKKFKDKDFPPIEKTKAEYVDLKTEKFSSNPKGGKAGTIDYLERGKRNKKIGDRGEQIVLQAEIKFLRDNKRFDLANKVDPVCRKDDSAGFDILSYDLNENEKYIEVKTTIGKVGNRSMYISANELKKSMDKENYYFYMVYDADSLKPKIWSIKSEELLNDQNIQKEPVLFKISLKAR